MSPTFDFIIVGGGTVGLVLAARLSEDPAIQVLVIEAGDDLNQDPRVTVPGMNQSLIGTSNDWNLKTVPQENLENRKMKVVGGRVLGGSSAINSFLFTPTSKAHLDAWSALGNPGWNWSSFSQSIAKAYNVIDSPWGSLGEGPLDVSLPAEETQWPRVWKETLGNLGLPVSANPFGGEMCGYVKDFETVHPTSKTRAYAVSAYLQPARSRSNLTVWTETPVEKVILENASTGELRATGVQYRQEDDSVQFVEAREVILSAGAIHSPRILELSGIGDTDLLSSLGIDVAINNPFVGENLQNHILLGIFTEVVKQEGFETLDKLLQQDPAAINAAQEAFAEGRGPMTGSNMVASAQMPLFDFSSSEDGKRELDALFDSWKDTIDLGKTTPAFAAAHESFVRSQLTSSSQASGLYNTFAGLMVLDGDGNMVPHPGGDDRFFGIGAQLCHPLSRGSTHIVSASASSSGPEIDPKYLSHPLDVEVLARHLQQIEKIKTTQPLANQLVPGGKTSPTKEEVDLAHLEEVKQYVRRAVQPSYHFSGTCSQMPREMGGVVDSKLRVYGCSNLRVCDMSIAPITPRCNAQATAYGIGEHAAQIIKADLAR